VRAAGCSLKKKGGRREPASPHPFLALNPGWRRSHRGHNVDGGGGRRVVLTPGGRRKAGSQIASRTRRGEERAGAPSSLSPAALRPPPLPPKKTKKTHKGRGAVSWAPEARLARRACMVVCGGARVARKGETQKKREEWRAGRRAF